MDALLLLTNYHLFCLAYSGPPPFLCPHWLLLISTGRPSDTTGNCRSYWRDSSGAGNIMDHIQITYRIVHDACR